MPDSRPNAIRCSICKRTRKPRYYRFPMPKTTSPIVPQKAEVAYLCEYCDTDKEAPDAEGGQAT